MSSELHHDTISLHLMPLCTVLFFTHTWHMRLLSAITPSDINLDVESIKWLFQREGWRRK